MGGGIYSRVAFNRVNVAHDNYFDQQKIPNLQYIPAKYRQNTNQI